MNEEQELKAMVVLLQEVGNLMQAATPFQREQIATYANNLRDWLNEKPEAKRARRLRDIEVLKERLELLIKEQEQEQAK